MAVGTVWAANTWGATDIWAANSWAAAQLQIVDPDNLLTLFLDDSTPVPAGAFYRSGRAYSPTGQLYVALWPSNNKVHYISGFAFRDDGALCIAPGGTEFLDLVGVSVTFRGEVRTTLAGRDIVKNGIPLTNDGLLCVQDQS